MPRLLTTLVLLCALFCLAMTYPQGTPLSATIGRSTALPLFAPPVPPALTAPCTDTIAGIADCPLTGCGELGDALLNQAKNRTDEPTGSIWHASLNNLRAIPQPAHWDTGSNRSSLQGTHQEGTAVVVSGIVLLVKPEGAESCNCELTKRVDTDVHIALVSDTEEAESTSVTVEVTPRVRANGHEGWLYKNVKDLEGEFIRVTGWLMLDTKHIPQLHRLPGERRDKPLVRATNWEVHPITKIEVCEQSVSSCKHGHGWQVYEPAP